MNYAPLMHQPSIAETPTELVHRGLRDYEGALVGYAYTILHDLDLARDAVQDTFLKLYQQTPGKVESTGLKSWLYTVCRNRCLDMLRKRKRLVSMDADTMEEFADETPVPSDAVGTESEVEDIMRYVKRLPANQQEVLRLKFQCDLSYKEISEATGLTVSNVGFLLHAAIKRLRGLLGAQSALAAPNF